MKKSSDKISVFDRIASFIYPSVCFCCGEITPQGVYVCGECRKILTDCKNKRPKAVSYCGRSITVYSPFVYKSAAASAVKLLKFSFRPDNAKPMGDAVADKAQKLRDKDFDIVTAVPMTAKSAADRKYNHAEQIAKRTASVLGVKFDASVLKKIRETKQQHTLSGLERRINVKNAFSASENAAGKHILLVDDVVTTGATICECASCLYSAGAKKVTCITFAAAKYSN